MLLLYLFFARPFGVHQLLYDHCTLPHHIYNIKLSSFVIDRPFDSNRRNPHHLTLFCVYLETLHSEIFFFWMLNIATDLWELHFYSSANSFQGNKNSDLGNSTKTLPRIVVYRTIELSEPLVLPNMWHENNANNYHIYIIFFDPFYHRVNSVSFPVLCLGIFSVQSIVSSLAEPYGEENHP
eukprot:UN29249